MDYKFPYWGPFLMDVEIEDETISLLLEKGKESQKKSNDARKNLAAVINKAYYYDTVEWFYPLFSPYVNTYVEGVSHYARAFKKLPTGWELYGLWINYQKANEYNPPHHHDGDLSFVIYLQVPEEIMKENDVHNNPGPGMIQFLLGPSMPLSVQSVGFMPKVGDIVIFPAWLPHYVNDFKSDVERISVSGNLNFMYHDLPPINVETGRPELGLDD